MTHRTSLIYWEALNEIGGVTPSIFKKLLNYSKEPYSILHQASEHELIEALDGVTKSQKERVVKGIQEYRKNPRDDFLDKRLTTAKNREIEVITIADEKYPANLKEVRDAPPLLYVLGSTPQHWRAIGVVGTRNPTDYGKEFAEGISREIARRRWVIVSGLARGIDTYAHKGALEAGPTVAVVASGLDKIYPAENKELFQEIATKGAVISEHPIGTGVSAANLVTRNRITSGLSVAIIVVETGKQGGTIHTIRYADVQKRKIFYAKPRDVRVKQARGVLLLHDKKVFYTKKLLEISTEVYEIPVTAGLFGSYADFVINKCEKVNK
ncbi:MAG: DNA-protecting protein DprA [Methanophagales archaeon]|nr:DNA-protecting protein DprA [Methanophagales archaeon]